MSTSTAIDLFSGAGGATRGLRDAGFNVVGAVEYDRVAAKSYALNHRNVRLWVDDIRNLPATAVARELDLAPGELTLLKACPPCQGFSSLADGRVTVDDLQNDLVLNTIRFVRVLRPRSVMLENVPGLGRDHRAATLIRALEKLGYVCRQYTVNAGQFGVPQRRKRLIILALRGRRRILPESLTGNGLDSPRETVRTTFEQLAAVLRDDDPISISRSLSDKVRQRVAAIPQGGNRFDLPPNLQLACHVKVDRKGHSATGSYGRMKLDELSPTMTTRCTTVACGSFIHPTEDRGITLREAAALQTFPHDYQFTGSYGEIERQIGNAVPVKMVSTLGRLIKDLVAT